MNPARRRIGSALLVGGTSDIGLAVLSGLVDGGLRRVVLAGRDPAGLDRAAERLRSAGVAEVHTRRFAADDPAEVQAALPVDASGTVGELDLICVSVGSLGRGTDTDAADLADTLQSTFLAPAVASRAGADVLCKQGHGHLVVLSSLAAVRPRPALLAYGAAKAGLDQFALGLADQLRGSGASVIVVRPGQVRTRMTAHLPDRPLTVDPDDVAAAVRRGISSGRRVVWVPAGARLAGAALRVLPRSVLRRIPA